MSLNVDDLLPLFDARFPEFKTVSEATKRIYLDDALCIFSLCEKAVLYLAAHLYVLDRDQSLSTQNGGAGIDDGLGEITSERIGKKATSYKHQTGKGGKSEVFYTTTAYGRKYLEFASKCPAKAFPIRVC